MKKVQTKNKLKGFFGLLAAFAMAIGVGVSLAPKEVVKTEAAESSTISFANANQRDSLNANAQVWSSGPIVMTVTKNTSSTNITDYTNPIRIYVGHKVEFTWDTGEVQSIESINFTANSTTYGGNTRGATLTNATATGTGATAVLTATVPTTPMSLVIGTQVRWNSLVVNYTKKASGSIATDMSVSPTSKTLYTTTALVQSNYVVSMTKDGSNITATADDYTVKIGSGLGSNFVGADVAWGNTLPKLADTVIQFKSVHPTTVGGSTFLTADVSITVLEPALESIVISGAMTKKVYFTVNPWDPTGLVVTGHYNNGAQLNVTSEVVWSYNPALPNSVSITSVTATATLDGKTDNVTVTGISISEMPVTSVVISEAYGGGGNSGAPLKQDFIELYNNTDAPIDITGWKLWYASATGAFSNSVELTGTILAKSYFLTEQGSGSGNPGDIPTADFKGSTLLNMGGSNFKVALTTDSVQPTSPTSTSVMDYVGAGTANAYEGTGVASAPANETSISRTLNAQGIMVDTNDNSADFTVGVPTPMNSAMSVAQKIMAYSSEAGTVEECVTKYNTIKPLVSGLSAGQKTFFQTDTRELVLNARLRYTQWAIANGDSEMYVAGGQGRIETRTSDNSLTATVIIGVIGLTTLAGYYFLQKKKEA